jgi:hypothetical protein
MVLQTSYGRHRGHSGVGGVESLTGLRNQTRERLTAGCLIEFAFLQYRRLTDGSPICSAAHRRTARGSVLKPSVRPAHFSGQSWTRKKVRYRAGNTTNVKMVTTNGPPVMANAWSPERCRVIGAASTHSRSSRRPPRWPLWRRLSAASLQACLPQFDTSCWGAGRRGNGGRFVEWARSAIPRRPRSQAIASADRSRQRVLWESRTTRVGALVSGTYWRSWRTIDWPRSRFLGDHGAHRMRRRRSAVVSRAQPGAESTSVDRASSNNSRALQSLNGDTTRSFQLDPGPCLLGLK